jgi:hypothetical protein
LPPAKAGGIKFIKLFKGFSQRNIILAKANLTFIHFPPAKAGGNSKS